MNIKKFLKTHLQFKNFLSWDSLKVNQNKLIKVLEIMIYLRDLVRRNNLKIVQEEYWQEEQIIKKSWKAGNFLQMFQINSIPRGTS